MSFLSHTLGRVGVLMGGSSTERSISIQSGTAVYQGLKGAGVDVVLIDITLTDADTVLKQIEDAGADIIFIALHGQFGEDGSVQAILDQKDIVYTGSAQQASRLAFNKVEAKKLFGKYDIKIPPYISLMKDEDYDLNTIFNHLNSAKVIVKPSREGSSYGITVVSDTDELKAALDFAWTFDAQVIIESFIEGRELTVGILGEQALPVIEICYSIGKYKENARFLCCLKSFLAVWKVETFQDCKTFLTAKNSFPMQADFPKKIDEVGTAMASSKCFLRQAMQHRRYDDRREEFSCEQTFFDFEAKYQKGRTQYIVPADIPDDLTARLKDTALRTHRLLGCDGFSRVDFMIDRKLCPYILEVNTIPGFTSTSLLPKAALKAGISFNQLCLTILELAYAKKKEINPAIAGH